MALFSNYKKHCDLAKNTLLKKLDLLCRHIEIVNKLLISDDNNFDYEYSASLFENIEFMLREIGFDFFNNEYYRCNRTNPANKTLCSDPYFAHTNLYAFSPRINQTEYQKYIHYRRDENISPRKFILPELTKASEEVSAEYNVENSDQEFSLVKEFELYYETRKSLFAESVLGFFTYNKASDYIRNFFKNNITPKEKEVCDKVISLLKNMVRQCLRHRFVPEVRDRIRVEFIDALWLNQYISDPFNFSRSIFDTIDFKFAPANKGNKYFNSREDERQFFEKEEYLNCYLIKNSDVFLDERVFNIVNKNRAYDNTIASFYVPVDIIEEADNEYGYRRLFFREIMDNPRFNEFSEKIYSHDLFIDGAFNKERTDLVDNFIIERNRVIREKKANERKEAEMLEDKRRMEKAISRFMEIGKEAVSNGMHVYYIEFDTNWCEIVNANCYVGESLKDVMSEIRLKYENFTRTTPEKVTFLKTLKCDERFK